MTDEPAEADAPKTGELTARDYLRTPDVGSQRPLVYAAVWTAIANGQSPSNWLELDELLAEPTVQYCLLNMHGPLRSVKFGVTGPGAALNEFVRKEFARIWLTSLPCLLRFLELDVSCGIVKYRYSEDDRRLHFDRLNELHPRWTRPLVVEDGPDRGQLIGLRPNGSGLGTSAGEDELFAPHYFWCSGETKFSQLWGRARTRGAYQPWKEKRSRHGAIDQRRLYHFKLAGVGGMLRYPPGQTNMGTEDMPLLVDNASIAKEINEKSMFGAQITLPSTRDEFGYKWEWTPAQLVGDSSGNRDYIDDLDQEIMRGMGVPKEVLEAAETGSGYSGRAIPMMMFYASLDSLIDIVVDAVNRCIIAHLVAHNFDTSTYEIVPEYLLDKFMQKDQQQQGQQGQPAPAMPGQPPAPAPGGDPSGGPMAGAMPTGTPPAPQMPPDDEMGDASTQALAEALARTDDPAERAKLTQAFQQFGQSGGDVGDDDPQQQAAAPQPDEAYADAAKQALAEALSTATSTEERQAIAEAFSQLMAEGRAA